MDERLTTTTSWLLLLFFESTYMYMYSFDNCYLYLPAFNEIFWCYVLCLLDFDGSFDPHNNISV